MELEIELEKWKNYYLTAYDDVQKQANLINNSFKTAEDKQKIKAYLEEFYTEHDAKKNRELRAFMLKISLNNLSKIIPLAYIAENYFRQSEEWLNERLNAENRNDPPEFTAEEYETLYFALKDMGKKVKRITRRISPVADEKGNSLLYYGLKTEVEEN